ncbi:MAG TPA: hypothetical protein VNS46_16805 [Nocardioides sp.]|nr:hypothetical protein [Nocardioides sp.]
MKKTTLALGSFALVAAFSLASCGGTDEGELAEEYCELAQDADDAAKSGDPDKVAEATEALTDWVAENEDTEGDEQEFEDAVEKKCPDFAP